MFKKRKGIDVPYNMQGYIYFNCINLGKIDMPKSMVDKIYNLCEKATPEHSDALFEMLTTDCKEKNVHAIAIKHFISESQLYYYRKKFYEMW